MLNHYAYCSANPIKYTDPTGLEDDWESWGNGGSGWEDGGRDYGSTDIGNTSLNPGLEDFCDKWNDFVDKWCGGGGGFDGVSPPSAAEREEYLFGALGKAKTPFETKMILNELGYTLSSTAGKGISGLGGGKIAGHVSYFNKNDLSFCQRVALTFSFMGLSPIDKDKISFIERGGLFQQIINWSARAGIPHYGIDIACINGTKVHSIQAGFVDRVTYNKNGYDNYFVSVWHGCGIYTNYVHMTSVNVQKGDFVFAGQTIGLSGLGHVHFEVNIDNFYNHFVNPLDILPSYISSFYQGNKNDIKY